MLEPEQFLMYWGAAGKNDTAATAKSLRTRNMPVLNHLSNIIGFGMREVDGCGCCMVFTVLVAPFY